MVLDMIAGIISWITGLFTGGLSGAVLIVGAALIVGTIVLSALRFGIALSNGRDVEESAERVGKWWVVVFGAIIGASMTGLVGLGEVTDLLVQLMGKNPLAFAEGITIGLGALGLSGAISLTWDQYVGIALLVVAGAVLAREVYGGDSGAY